MALSMGDSQVTCRAELIDHHLMTRRQSVRLTSTRSRRIAESTVASSSGRSGALRREAGYEQDHARRGVLCRRLSTPTWASVELLPALGGSAPSGDSITRRHR